MTRLEKLRSLIPDGIDALLITDEINQRYITGFDYTDGYVLISRDIALVLCDFRYIEAAKNTIGKDFEVRMFSGPRAVWLDDIFYQNKIEIIAYEDESISVASLRRLEKDFPTRHFLPMGDIISKMRQIKDEYEIENIITAQRIAEGAFEHILGYINPSRTENDVALELENYMRRHGAEGVAFKTIAVSGSATSLPHGEPRNIRLQKGFITMDFGAKYNGYCSDMTRTICLGPADDEMKRLYNTVLTAQTEAIRSLYIGIKGKDADKVARDIIDNAGYRGAFGHSLGHSVGMYIHESPVFSQKSENEFGPGHVVTCEPGIYLEGKYGCRIEDMIVFMPDGEIVDITKSPKELIEI